MSNEFTADEIREAVDAAQIYSSGYTEEQFQASRELVKRLPESGYLGAVCSITKLEKEKGVHCTKALDACQELLQEKVGLERSVAALEIKLKRVEGEVTQAQDTLHQLEEATKQAKTEREQEEKELAAFRKKADKENQAIEKELEQCRQEAGVTKEEITTAGQLKVEVEKHGFSLELALDLSQEFAGYEDIMDKVAEELKKGETLIEFNEQAEERKKALQTDIQGLEGNRQQLESKLSQLQADTAFEEELRRFYHRYQSAGWFMERLASWRDIFFGRCGNPLYASTRLLDQSTRGADFWTEKPLGGRCPSCDYPLVSYDKEIYQALNLPIGEPYKLQLGQ